MQPQGVGFMSRNGLKTGIDFAHFGLELVMDFEEITGVYERIGRFNSKWIMSDTYDILMTDKSEEFANVNVYLFVWFSGLKAVTMQGAVREP